MKLITLITILLTSLSSHAVIDALQLHASLKKSHTNQMEYKVSKRHIFNTVDNYQGEVCSAYTPLECKNYNQTNNHSKNDDKGFKLNTEHTWPQSKGAKFFPAQGDLHHLYAASKESNSKRENFPFCIVFDTSWEKQGSRVGFDKNLQDCFEPVDKHKGNVARAMFYFSVRYKKEIKDNQEPIFRAWNKLDPVDSFERLRNDKIEKLQGNRNPFIDNERLAEEIPVFKFPRI